MIQLLRNLLKAFMKHRELVAKAMGDGRYLLNPITGICPFDGSSCKCARHRFNAVNSYPFLFNTATSHLRSVHRTHPAVPILIKRFEIFKRHPDMAEDNPALNAYPNPLTSEWMADHADEVGDDGLRSIEAESKKDLFLPASDVSTNLGRAMWAEGVKCDYAALLKTRQAEREAGAAAHV